jgi:gas vesicle protein
MLSNLETIIKYSKYFIVFFSGIVTGGILGIILAPKSGKETRDDLIKQSNEITDLTKKELAKIHELGYTRIERISKSLNKKKEELAHSSSQFLGTKTANGKSKVS